MRYHLLETERARPHYGLKLCRHVLTAVAAQLNNEDEIVRRAAVEALGRRVTLPDGVLTAMTAQLDDEDWGVRNAAVEALGQRVMLRPSRARNAA
ncbi:hypothetical protein NHJ13051_008766 [Beauveria bassiana]